MKFHKTPRSKRSTYTYEVYDADGIKLPSIVIRPGEEGVTEVDIKALHALDDSEVYYNLKASKPRTDTELKNKREEWRAQYIEEFIKKYGYSPHPKDVEDAVKERFPKNWTESLEKLQESNDDADKSALSLLFFVPIFLRRWNRCVRLWKIYRRTSSMCIGKCWLAVRRKRMWQQSLVFQMFG